MSQQLHYWVGMERRAKKDEQGERLPDAGADGMVWVPQQDLILVDQRGVFRSAVAAVCDGVSTRGGDGDMMVRDYARHLAQNEAAKDAFKSLVQETRSFPSADRNASTMVSLDLPEVLTTPAQLMAVGDSSCRRLRADVLETLTQPHTAWENVLEFLEASDPEKVVLLRRLEDSEEFKKAPESDLVAARKAFNSPFSILYGLNLYSWASRRVQKWMTEDLSEEERAEITSRDYAAHIFEQMMIRAGHALVADMTSGWNTVRDLIEDEKFTFPVQIGDRYLLSTDGVDLSPADIRSILMETVNPVVAALILVEESSGHDDATAVVVDVLSQARRRQVDRVMFSSLSGQNPERLPMAS